MMATILFILMLIHSLNSIFTKYLLAIYIGIRFYFIVAWAKDMRRYIFVWHGILLINIFHGLSMKSRRRYKIRIGFSLKSLCFMFRALILLFREIIFWIVGWMSYKNLFELIHEKIIMLLFMIAKSSSFLLRIKFTYPCYESLFQKVIFLLYKIPNDLINTKL